MQAVRQRYLTENGHHKLSTRDALIKAAQTAPKGKESNKLLPPLKEECIQLATMKLLIQIAPAQTA